MMRVEEHQWHSPLLGKSMPIKIYGHWGLPILVFPCSLGRYYDYEGMGMIEAISDYIERGAIKLYCIDSVDAESWYHFSVPVEQRNQRAEDYDHYVVDEVVPFIRQHCHQEQLRIFTNGCSMGAYHAVNCFLKHPDYFAGCIALSGLYRLDHTEFGLNTQDMMEAYFNSPLHYLPGLDHPWYLDWYRKSRIIVCVGQGAWEDEPLQDTRELANVLREKKIPAWVDFWGVDVDHDWPWWHRQMRYFLEDIL